MRVFLAVIMLALLCPVSAQDSNLNLNLNIPVNYQTAYADGDLVVELEILNLKADRRVDVVIDYSIETLDGYLILNEQETVAIETKASFVKTLHIPADMEPGKYSVSVNAKVINSNLSGSTKASFEVAEKPRVIVDIVVGFLLNNLLWLILSAALIAAVYLSKNFKIKEKIHMFILRGRIHSSVKKKLKK